MSKANTKKSVNPAMFDVIRSPLVTEKSQVNLELHNKVTFKVATYATKQQIKSAVEAIFKVDVKKVNIVNLKGKVKRFRGIEGKRNDLKKAIVTLAEGQSIDTTANV